MCLQRIFSRLLGLWNSCLAFEKVEELQFCLGLVLLSILQMSSFFFLHLNSASCLPYFLSSCLFFFIAFFLLSLPNIFLQTVKEPKTDRRASEAQRRHVSHSDWLSVCNNDNTNKNMENKKASIFKRLTKKTPSPFR